MDTLIYVTQVQVLALGRLLCGFPFGYPCHLNVWALHVARGRRTLWMWGEVSWAELTPRFGLSEGGMSFSSPASPFADSSLVWSGTSKGEDGGINLTKLPNQLHPPSGPLLSHPHYQWGIQSSFEHWTRSLKRCPCTRTDAPANQAIQTRTPMILCIALITTLTSVGN